MTNDATKLLRNQIFFNRIMKHGGNLKRLATTLNKLFGCHFYVFHKYNSTSQEFAESLLDWGYDNIILQNLII